MPKIISLPPMNDPPESDDLLAIRDMSAENTKKVTMALVLAAIYPIGSIYINATDNTNPGTLLGFGTWVAFGAGRVPVGFDSGDTDFDTAEETGGSKTHTHSLDSETAHAQLTGSATGNTSPKFSRFTTPNWTANIQASGGWNAAGSSAAQSSGTKLGGDTADGSTLQPYITVYMWKRTA